MTKLGIVLTVMTLAAGAPAYGAVDTNLVMPLNMVVFVPCAAGGAGEMVQLSGNLHIVFSATVNGDTMHFRSHFNPQGTGGVGLTTGDKYRGTGVTRSDLNVQGVIFPYVSTTVNNFRIIGQGPGNNSLLHVNTHVRVNGDGEVTADVNHVTASCK